MFSIGLYPLVDIPNRISNHSVSLIDNICTNVTNHKVANGIVVSAIIYNLPFFLYLSQPQSGRT